MFSEKEKKQIADKGIPLAEIDRQLENFEKGFPFLNISRMATVGDGIARFSEEEIRFITDLFDHKKEGLSIVKFVPASGAASRMFKDLYEYLDTGILTKEVREVTDRIEEFAFYEDLKASNVGTDDPKTLVKAILHAPLNYGTMPKGAVKFHHYPEGGRTAIEEHLVEGALYGNAGDGNANIHFTVSPEHQAIFGKLTAEKIPRYEERFGLKYNISYSQQKSNTDIVAVDENNRPVRNADGSLLFWPAGHGALLGNLNEIEADLIFIKNIDNVSTEKRAEEAAKYKKLLAGLLLGIQTNVFEYLTKFKLGKITDGNIADAADFIQRRLSCKLPQNYPLLDRQEKISFLKSVLNRPIRVCGMVKNEGEPGGGPFWVRNNDGSESLQIAESVQISPDQKCLMAESTHFNPVDLVCSIKNYKGKTFDLKKYRDPDSGLISLKSIGGKIVKAQELPGLWNGSMAGWITLFVEVPVATFTPVKTVNDLLRPPHQP